jgi:hypothetical protein
MYFIIILYKNGEKKDYLAKRYEMFDSGTVFFMVLAETFIWINMSEVKEIVLEENKTK